MFGYILLVDGVPLEIYLDLEKADQKALELNGTVMMARVVDGYLMSRHTVHTIEQALQDEGLVNP